MKKSILTAGMILAAVAAIVVFKSFPPGAASTSPQSNGRSAASLQSKIEVIKKANADKNRSVQEKLEISEAELESYVMIVLRKDIPVNVESIRVHLTPGAIAADTRLSIPPGSTGNVLVDALVGGTHNLLVGGKVHTAKGEGKFDLVDLRVDGIPVPNLLIDTLIKKYAKPKYPQADIKAPFDLPWGIEAIDIGQGKATVTY